MMNIRVRLYSIARHRDGKIIDRLTLELPAGSRIGDVLTALEINPDLEPVLSLNDVIAEESASLGDGDEVGVIPAVAGG
jgi:molybdopterin converting factor small subunit